MSTLSTSRTVVSKPSAVVVGLSATGLAIARILGRRGVRIYGVEPRPWELGRLSRYVRLRASLREAMRELGAGGAVFFSGDPELYWAMHSAADAPWMRFLDRRAGDLLDKALQYERCLDVSSDLPMTVPKTWRPRCWQDWQQIPNSYPLVVKPRFGGASQTIPKRGKVWVSPERIDLIDFARARGLVPDEVILQELVSGAEQEIEVCVLYRRQDGSFGSCMTGQKLLQRPRGFGSASHLTTTDAPELVALSQRLATRLEIRGLLSFEWKVTSQGRALIEINPRAPLFAAIAPEVVLDAFRDMAGLLSRAPCVVPKGRVWTYRIREPFTRLPSQATDALRASDDPWPTRFSAPYTALLAGARWFGFRHSARPVLDFDA